MKTTLVWKLAGAALLASMVSLGAQAQSSDAMAASGTTGATASGKPTKAERTANRALQRKVRGALAKTNGLTVSNISVRARGGAVTLAGTVPDGSQLDLAANAAKGVAGVTSVKNALAVRPLGQ